MLIFPKIEWNFTSILTVTLRISLTWRGGGGGGGALSPPGSDSERYSCLFANMNHMSASIFNHCNVRYFATWTKHIIWNLACTGHDY